MEAQQKHRLYLKDIKQLVPVSTEKKQFLRMKQCQDISVLSNYSVLVNNKGIIEKVGPAEQIAKHIQSNKLHFQQTIDCSKFCVIPGYVDGHTHAVFYGDRSKQYDMKLNGMGYVEIYQQGLGIRYTTNAVAKATVEELAEHLDRYLPRMSKLGTTTVEIKSGYGLNAENQVKMLKAIEIARKKYEDKLTIVSTFCGAHAIPKGKTQAEQTDDVINSQIPAVKKAIQNKEISPVFIDVFCEKNFFEGETSTKIMQEGKKIGLIPNFHGDQLNNLESGTIGAKVGARSISHLQYLSDESIKQMSENKIAGVLLPTTQNIEKLPIPPIKKMREQNMIVALGSDFCPNAFCYNMGLTAHYSCTNYRLTPKEAIVAATLNSAYSLNLSDKVGSIEQGKQGDFLILDIENWVYIVYQFGDTFIHSVVKNGKIL